MILKAKGSAEVCSMNKHLIPVYAVCERTSHPPAALGSLITYAKNYKDGELLSKYEFIPRLFPTTRALHRAIRHHGEGIILFSSYIWNFETNMVVSRGIKARHPHSITLHGGPSVPKYPEASESFFANHPHIDITARGEGEQTFVEILECLAGIDSFRGPLPLRLQEVPGITCRDMSGKPIRTADRATIKDVAQIPSSYVGGFFESLPKTNWLAAIIETNRGCPYGCTYCDWGSATLQKLRLFPMDHVKREIVWAAKNQIEVLWMADANFGILERDVEIAEFIAETKAKYGYPQQMVTNYAKNATERLGRIISVLAKAGLPSEGTLTVQTRDSNTLANIKRSNIKNERYEELLEIFRDLRLPIATDLLIGLPGMTLETLSRDLQYFFEQEVHVQVYQIRMLPNSPMAHPDYQKEFGIKVDDSGMVVGSTSFTEKDVDAMHDHYGTYTTLISHGLARYLLHWLQRDHGIPAMKAMEVIRGAAESNAKTYPTMHRTLNHFKRTLNTRANEFRYRTTVLFTPWERFYNEMGELLKAEFGIPDDSALATMLACQRAIMPAVGRSLPQSFKLQHDVLGYIRGMRRARAANEPVKPLISYPPGDLEVSDPLRMCRRPLELLIPYATNRIHFELRSTLQTDTTKHRFMFVTEVTGIRWWFQIPLATLRIAGFVVRGQLRRLDHFLNTAASHRRAQPLRPSASPAVAKAGAPSSDHGA